MTSGNVADEPIAYTDEEALARLGRVADLSSCCTTGRSSRACDDSVARVIAGRPVVLRRSRGYVPRPIVLARPVARPVLACGGLLKNTFCLARGDEACLGPHIGDLENLDTFNSYRESIDRLRAVPALRAGDRRARPASRLPVVAIRGGAPRARCRSRSSTITPTSPA